MDCETWLVDSGASHHMSPCIHHFGRLRASAVQQVWLADDSVVLVVGQGDIVIHGLGEPVTIRDVLYIPSLTVPLLSVPAVFDHGGSVRFTPESVDLFSSRSSRVPVLTGHRAGTGWRLTVRPLLRPSPQSLPTQTPADLCLICSDVKLCCDGCASAVRGADTASSKGTWSLWHSRLGHLGWQQLKRVLSSDMVKGTQVTDRFPSSPLCDGCLEGKMHEHPFGVASFRASRPFELLHTDLMGPVDTPSVFRHKYIMVIVDDFTRYAWVYFLRKKSHAAAQLKDFFAYASRQFEATVRRVRSDRGGEFLDGKLGAWFQRLGVVHELSISHTPQQNGVAERFNRTLTERSRSLLLSSGLPVRFWEHAVSYASWVNNRLPSTALPGSQIPYTLLWGSPPNLAMAKVFGSLAHVWIDPETLPRKLKFGPRSRWAVFLGISEESKGWTFYVPGTGETGFLSRNAFFHEDLSLHDLESKGGTVPLVDVVGSQSERDQQVYELFPAGPSRTFARGKRRVRWVDGLSGSETTIPFPPVGPPLGVPQGEGESSPVPAALYPAPAVSEGERPSVAEVPRPPHSQGESPVTVTPPPPAVPAREVCADPEASLDSFLPHDEEDQACSDSSSEHDERDFYPYVSDQGESEPDVDDAVSSSSEEEEPPLPQAGDVEALPLLRRSGRERRTPARFSPTMSGSHRIVPPAPAQSRDPRSSVVSCFPSAFHSRWNRGRALSTTARPSVYEQTLLVPTSIKLAEASPASEEWLEARHKELDRLDEMGTWELVDCPPRANVLGSKWVFALKQNPDGTIARFKARLVVQGFGQKEGVDYDETFASTAGKLTIRCFLALVTVLGMQVKQVDVTTAFLYGTVDKDIYVRQPPGHGDGTERVCKLRRALYGLKQSPRIWEEKLRSSLQGLGFASSTVDPCLYTMRRDGQLVFILDFVDDMLIASHSQSHIDWVYSELCKEYALTDEGEPQKYVGFYISHDRVRGEMFVHQAPYIHDKAERFGLSGGATPDTPLPSDWVLFHPWELDGDSPQPQGKSDPLLGPDGHKRYEQLVGSLNYAAHTTRIDISHAVNQLSRATRAPRARHLAAAERVMRYLVGTATMGLHFTQRAGLTLECFVDASYSKQGDQKAITGFLLSLGGGPIMWTSRKQDRITTSTCDAESYAVVTAVQYVEYARDLLEELGATQFSPTLVHNDNSATINLCHDALSHKRSIQLTRQMAYVRERTLFGIISPVHISTKDQPADYLTKRLDGASFQRCSDMSGLRTLVPPQSSPTAVPSRGGVLSDAQLAAVQLAASGSRRAPGASPGVQTCCLSAITVGLPCLSLLCDLCRDSRVSGPQQDAEDMPQFRVERPEQSQMLECQPAGRHGRQSSTVADPALPPAD